MASTFLRKFSSNIGNTATSVGSYTVGANTGAVVIGLTVSNTTNSELNADVTLYNGISPYYLARRMPIPSESSLVVAGGDQKVVLQAGDSIQVQTESGYGLDAIMTVMETNSIGITVDTFSMGWAFTNTVPMMSGNYTLSSVIWDDTKFVAIRGGLQGYYSNSGAYSLDGLNWTETTLPGEARGIFGIAYGEGITVAPYYESRNVAVSTDGITWTKEVTVLPSVKDDLGSVFETTVMGVAYGNGKFIAVDLIQDLTLVSDDGLTWDYGGNVALGYQQGFPTGLGYKISIQFGGGTFMIRTQNTFNSVHGGVIRSTDDGASWSVSEFSGPDGSWVIGYGNGAWVALPLTGESTGRTIGMISTDSGNTWANTTIPAGLYSSIVHDGTKFVGMPNTGNIIVSGNGTTWTSITTPDFQGEPSVQNIAVNPQISAYGDGMIVALTGYEEGGIGKALYSGSVGNPIIYSYSITSNISSVNEGNTVGFTVSTSNVPNSTVLYWTTVGNVSSADFSDSVSSGNVTVSNGSATITRTLVADATTEGVEYFDLELRTGSTSGTIVATSGNTTVIDTSIALPQWVAAAQGYPTTSASVFSATSGQLSSTPDTLYSSFATNSYHFDVTVSPQNDFVYFPNGTKNWIDVIPVDPSTGIYTGSGATTSASNGNFPIRMSISPDGKHAYVSQNNSANLGIYTRNATTGALTGVSTFSGYGPSILSSDGLNLYVSSSSSGIQSFSRNTTTGALTLLDTESTYINAAFMNNGMIKLTNDDTSVFVTDYASENLYNYSRNMSTGVLTLEQTISFSGYRTTGVTVSNDGKFVYVALGDTNSVVPPTVKMFSRSLSAPYTLTLSNTYIATSNPGDVASGFILTKNQNLLVWAGATTTLYSWTRNLTTGARTLNADVTTGFGAGIAGTN
jgi:6-phosphogluconolactonase (cycloisomerase 2 family)